MSFSPSTARLQGDSSLGVNLKLEGHTRAAQFLPIFIRSQLIALFKFSIVLCETKHILSLFMADCNFLPSLDQLPRPGPATH